MAKIEEDQRLQDIETKRDEALGKIEATYGGMIAESDKFYQDQIDASQAWEEQQKDFQQQQTDMAVDRIEQQKAKAEKDLAKEQSGAYVDWQKQSNKYGVEAERQAEAGLTGSGYSESSQVSMYNAYQNRVSVAREVFAQANLEFDNAIKEATLQGSVAMANIAYQAYQQRLQLALSGFEYKNTLLLEQLSREEAINAEYDSLWQSVYNQLLAERNARRYSSKKTEDEPEGGSLFLEDPKTYAPFVSPEAKAENEQYVQNNRTGKDAVVDSVLNSSNSSLGFLKTKMPTGGQSDKYPGNTYDASNWTATDVRNLRELQRQEWIEQNGPEYIASALAEYPDGKIKDKDIWDMLCYYLTEDYVKKNGLSKG